MTHDFHLNVNLNVNILIENAYAQHECTHDNFKKKHEPAYNELTNAIKASAHDQLTPQQFQEWNQPTTIQCLIKRLWKNTREWRRRQRKRQQQKANQHQPGTTNSNSCKRQRTHALSGHVNVQPRDSTPVQSHPPAKKQKLRAPTRRMQTMALANH